MTARPIAPTRRTTPSARARSSAAAAAAVLLAVALGGCTSGSGSDGKSKPDGAEGTSTTTTPPVPLDPAAGTYGLAYLSTESSQTTVFLTDGKGSKTDVVARVPGRAEALTWSPDGKQLLLDGDAGTEDFEVQVVDAETGTVSALAPSPTSNEGGASWSPDGASVAFFSNREGGFAGYVVPSSGGNPTRVTPPEAGNVTDLTWSPDGKRLAFSTSTELESDVWVVDAGGTNARKVSSDAGSTQPAWSPDGDVLAITAEPEGADTPGIYALDAESGETTTLADTEYVDGFPVWAPDGESVYFMSAVPNDDADGGSADDILRVDLEGGAPEPVTSDPISVESELRPTVDGTLIVFSVQRLGDKEVFVANADGTGAIPISRSERQDAFGTWRPGTGPS